MAFHAPPPKKKIPGQFLLAPHFFQHPIYSLIKRSLFAFTSHLLPQTLTDCRSCLNPLSPSVFVGSRPALLTVTIVVHSLLVRLSARRALCSNIHSSVTSRLNQTVMMPRWMWGTFWGMICMKSIDLWHEIHIVTVSDVCVQCFNVLAATILFTERCHTCFNSVWLQGLKLFIRRVLDLRCDWNLDASMPDWQTLQRVAAISYVSSVLLFIFNAWDNMRTVIPHSIQKAQHNFSSSGDHMPKLTHRGQYCSCVVLWPYEVWKFSQWNDGDDK